MRVYWVLGIMMAAALSARSEECAVDVILKVDAVLPAGVLQKAEFRTSEMFKEIGVDVRLRTGSTPRTDQNAACGPSIVARITAGNPLGFSSQMLAYAEPFAVSGTRIHVFVNRIIKDHRADLAQVLTHVLVHEITHVLEGTAHHSDYGVMKAHWDNRDFIEMRVRALPFADFDVAMIHRGIAKTNVPMTDSAVESSPLL